MISVENESFEHAESTDWDGVEERLALAWGNQSIDVASLLWSSEEVEVDTLPGLWSDEDWSNDAAERYPYLDDLVANIDEAPPILVTQGSNGLVILDGAHRRNAAHRAGRRKIRVYRAIKPEAKSAPH